MPTKAETAWRALPHKFAEVASQGQWQPYPHLKPLSLHIAKGIAEGGLRIIVSMPPRHGKSELMSHWLPTWFLEMWPSKRVILATYGDQFATKWGRQVRNEVKNNPAVCNAILASDKEAASNFYTEQGGGMLSAGIMSGITGSGADAMIIDDAIKNWEQAHSKNVRDKINEEFEATLNTRLEPGASVIVLMTRWHSQDLAGFASERYGWPFYRFPAISDEGSIDNPLDPRSEPGLPLCPERYDIDALNDIKSNLSSKMWQALYQQTPVDQQEESLWNYDIIKYTNEDINNMEKIVIAVDPAVTSNKNSDETGIVAAGRLRSGDFVVLEDASLKGTPSRWASVAVSLYRKYEADRIVAEVNNGGDMVEQMIRQVDRDVSYEDVRATRGKTLRAEPIVALYENDRVRHAGKFDKLEEQMVLYSGESTTDSPDRMDALVWAISYLSEDEGGESRGRFSVWAGA